jgi:hypothetical protein
MNTPFTIASVSSTPSWVLSSSYLNQPNLDGWDKFNRDSQQVSLFQVWKCLCDRLSPSWSLLRTRFKNSPGWALPLRAKFGEENSTKVRSPPNRNEDATSRGVDKFYDTGILMIYNWLVSLKGKGVPVRLPDSFLALSLHASKPMLTFPEAMIQPISKVSSVMKYAALCASCFANWL